MSYDLSHLTEPGSAAPFTVTLPDGELALRPVVALPTDGQAAMLRLSGRLAEVAGDDVGEDGVASMDLAVMTRALADSLPDVDALLRAACPSKTAANKLLKLVNGSLMDKIGLVVAYIGQEQAGEASPSAS
ncbi:hypothetical protein [Nocardiopsis synnemataformans]|uniref:hypothetical protein n=1 Tax=Nocardiopsis synnemataformans TaxID=61305 RepID=UPI003EBE31A2